MKRPRLQRREQLDWAEVRRGLAAAAAAQTLSPAQAQEVLEQRARALACVPSGEMQQDAVFEVVTFSLADERYGLAARYVREVIRWADFTPVLRAPALLAAVINLRGENLPVFDLGQLFGVQLRGGGDAARVLVVGEQAAEFGILADAAYEVRAVRTEAVQETPATVVGSSRTCLLGVLPEGLILLDGAALLQDPRLAIDQSEDGRVLSLAPVQAPET